MLYGMPTPFAEMSFTSTYRVIRRAPPISVQTLCTGILMASMIFIVLIYKLDQRYICVSDLE